MSVNSDSREIKRPLLWHLLILAALIALTFACFGRTLGGFYLADDYVHVAYLSKVFSGHPELLWQNFYTNWLNTQGTHFYRPLISLTLAFDYLLWHANPLGYHLTNTLYQAASSIFLYLLTCRLLRGFGSRQATVAGFFTAAIFAALPLHAEVVSWIIGRVDGVCTAFYLLSFWLFVRWHQSKCKFSLPASVVAFIAALLSKEMAVTLPPVLVMYCLLDKPTNITWMEHIKAAFIATSIFWATLIGYLVVRTLSLGTISGGYTGSIGEGLNGSLYKRLFQDGSFMRVLFPFDAEVFSPFDKLRKFLNTLYILSGITIALRVLLSFKQTGLTRYIGFALAWFVIAMIPTYQVFNLTANLQSSRFIYMGTAPLCLLLVLLIYPLFVNNSRFSRIFQIAASLLLVGFLVCFVQVAQKNNLPFVAAGREVRALRMGLERAVRQLPAGKQIVLLNLPQRVGGAHELYNAAMLWILLQPPLTTPAIADKVATFEPMTYGDSEIFIVSRLRRMLEANPHGYEFYVWNRNRLALQPVDIELLNKEVVFDRKDFVASGNNIKATSNGLLITSLDSDQYLVTPFVNLSPASIDFADIELTVQPVESITESNVLCLYWDSQNDRGFSPERRLALLVERDGKPHRYRFNVSEHKSWIMAGNVNQLRLELPISSSPTILHSVKLASGRNEIAQLTPDAETLRLDKEGVYRIPSGTAKFFYDVSGIAGATGIIAELSKPDSWFEHYTGQLRDQALSPNTSKNWNLDKVKGVLEFPANFLSGSAYYQVRIAAIDKQGKVVGYVSDPVNLQAGGSSQ